MFIDNIFLRFIAFETFFPSFEADTISYFLLMHIF